MSNFSIFMLIVGTSVLLVGIYLFTGCKLSAIAWNKPYKSKWQQQFKIIGKWMMIVSLFPFVLAIIDLIF